MCDTISEAKYQEELAAIESLGELMAEEARVNRLQSNDSLELWETKDRRRVDYRDLSDLHLKNAVRMLQRTGYLYCCPRLQIELRHRGSEPNRAD